MSFQIHCPEALPIRGEALPITIQYDIVTAKKREPDVEEGNAAAVTK
jgi:hypothetical protein